MDLGSWQVKGLKTSAGCQVLIEGELSRVHGLADGSPARK